MVQTISILPGITLRCFQDNRFKQSCLTVQFVRPMCREEAAKNALLPAVLLRGCEGAPDLRSITLKLDDLYGAAIGPLVRRVGDYQSTGLHCSFVADKYALEGDKILEPMVDFLGKLLFAPVLEEGAFRKDYVNNEKKNLIATIEAEKNDKRAYAAAELLRRMCSEDSYGIPRLGTVSNVKAISAKSLYDHYCRVLKESRVDIFYVGSMDAQAVAAMTEKLFADKERCYVNLSEQTAFASPAGGEQQQVMDVAQGKLSMGFETDITLRSPQFVQMQVCNMVFGGGMTSKLFMQVREKNSLCYDIGSAYYGSKGILTVGAGIDCAKKDEVQEHILTQLEACKKGDVTDEELNAAKQALICSLQGVHDSAAGIENYYATGALSGQTMTPQQHSQAIEDVTKQQVQEMAKTLKLHTVFFLRGEG